MRSIGVSAGLRAAAFAALGAGALAVPGCCDFKWKCPEERRGDVVAMERGYEYENGDGYAYDDRCAGWDAVRGDRCCPPCPPCPEPQRETVYREPVYEAPRENVYRSEGGTLYLTAPCGVGPIREQDRR